MNQQTFLTKEGSFNFVLKWVKVPSLHKGEKYILMNDKIVLLQLQEKVNEMFPLLVLCDRYSSF